MLYSTESKYQKIEVLDSESSLGKILTLNGLMFVTEGDAYHYNEMITHVPMISHPCPKNILIIGGGTGASTHEVLKHNTVEKVVVVDIDEEVVNTCKKYLPKIASGLDNPKVQVKIENAFEYIKNNTYIEELFLDFIVLNDDGIIVMQSESPVANVEKSKKLYESLLKVFKIVKTYTSPVPTYPGSCWAWAYCSQTVEPLKNIDEKRYEEVVSQCKLFNKKYAQQRFEQETILDELL